MKINMLSLQSRPQNTTVVSDCQLTGKLTAHILQEELRILLDEDLRDPNHTLAEGVTDCSPWQCHLLRSVFSCPKAH